MLHVQVKRCIQEESVRIRRYLHPFTYQRIEFECHLWLICEENINFISDSCSEIVQRGQWKGDYMRALGFCLTGLQTFG